MSGAGDLSAWAAQGVLLLNAVLTVERGRAGAHAGLGWEGLTDRLLAAAAAAPGPRAYLLWGRWAQSKEACIRAAARGPALILKANHPSPLSASRPPAPFLGCGHFREASDWLAAQGAGPVDWLAPWREAPAQPGLF